MEVEALVRFPQRVRRSGGFSLPLPPRQAFELFTAEGEKLWVPGWSPEILGSTPQETGLVFLTGRERESTIWTVLESDPRSGRVLYSRVTPGLRAGTVEVVLAPEIGGSRIKVTYDLTALSDSDAALAGYSEVKFTEMLDQWRTLILRYLDRLRRAGPHA
jgi:hypothetical protein